MKHSLLIVCILIFGVLICGCAYFNSNTTKDAIPSDKYVALLEEYTNRSTLIGTPPYTPVRPMPIPTPVPIFNYDNSQGYLNSELANYGYGLNDSFKVLIGRITYTDTPTMLGYKGIELMGVYDLPYTTDDGLTLVNVTGNGTIIATFDGMPIILKPGENWTTVKVDDNVSGAYLANIPNNDPYDYWNVTVLPWPVRYEKNYTFTNKGVFNKSVPRAS